MRFEGNKYTLLLVVWGCLFLAVDAQAGRPILIWDFDEGAGPVVKDGSGYGRDGVVDSAVTYNAEGPTGQGWSASFNSPPNKKEGTDIVIDEDAGDYLNGLENVTFSIWCNSKFTNIDRGMLAMAQSTKDQGGIRYDRKGFAGGGVSLIKSSVLVPDGEVGFEGTSGTQVKGEWQHIVMVWESGVGLQQYIDGEADVPTSLFGPTSGALTGVEFLKVGIGVFYQNWAGLLDDLVIYDVALSAAEVQDLYMNGPEASLKEPGIVSPRKHEAIEETSTTLTWLAGNSAVSQRLYFSEDFDAVNDRDPNALVLSPPKAQTTYAVDALKRARTYYWRVDAVDGEGAITGAEVWQFSIKDVKAFDPSPRDGATYVSPEQMLSWQFGVGSVADVFYIGTDADTVAAATGGTPQFDPNYTPEAPFAEGATYYWRVDEIQDVDGQEVVVKGDVWSFTTVPTFPIEDESLLGWWTFDEEGAATAVDSSGHGLHGILVAGTPQWVSGAVNRAMEFNGSLYQTPAPDVNATSATFSAWVKLTRGNTQTAIIAPSQWGTGLTIDEHNNLVCRWNGTPYGIRAEDPNVTIPMNEWTFLAGVVAPDSTRIYLNSTEWFFDYPGENGEEALDEPFRLGGGAVNRYLGGLLDDVRIYTRALSLEEVQALIQAGNPPVDATDPNVVVVDDFDSYKSYFNQLASDPNIWDVWLDGFGGNGSGSAVAHAEEPLMERLFVRHHGQSLPFYYDNTGSGRFKDFDGNPVTVTYSDTFRTFNPAMDFTAGGVTTVLTLFLRGDLDNTVEAGDKVTLSLSDGTNTVDLPVADPAPLTAAKWIEVAIPLAGLSVDLTKITGLRLTIGTPNSPGGVGRIYIDNIALRISQ